MHKGRQEETRRKKEWFSDGPEWDVERNTVFTRVKKVKKKKQREMGAQSRGVAT